MSGLRSFARLHPAERGLLLSTVLVVAIIRIGLWVLPFLRLQRLVRSLHHVPFSMPTHTPVARLVWAVRAASARVPASSCLTQSLALQVLLSRAGHPSQVRIGMDKDLNTGFHAHAWVECEGNLLLSTSSEIERYLPLFAIEVERA